MSQSSKTLHGTVSTKATSIKSVSGSGAIGNLAVGDFGYYFTDGITDYENVSDLYEKYIFDDVTIIIRSESTNENLKPKIYKFKIEETN